MNINWLKLDINILDDTKIKIIRKYPDGNALFLLWIGLLCLAMKSENTGMIEITSGIPYSVEDLSNILEIEKKTVEMGLNIFNKLKMIEYLANETIFIINLSKHQQLDKIETSKELNRLRQINFRKKQKEKLILNDSNVTVTLHNAPVTTQIRVDNNITEPDNIIKDVKIFFTIAKNPIAIKPSEYATQNCGIALDHLMIQFELKDLNGIAKYIDNKGIGYDFEDENHFKNVLRIVFEKHSSECRPKLPKAHDLPR